MVVGLVLFGVGAYFFATTVGHVQDRIDIWLDPFPRYKTRATRSPTGCSRWPTAGCSGRGWGRRSNVPDGGPLLPAPQTDMIYAVIVNDLGLVGGCGVILTYLLIAERGFKIATLAPTRSRSCWRPG